MKRPVLGKILKVMIDVTDLRRGVTFQFGSNPYQVVEYIHTKLGRGGATVKVQARNLKTGAIEEKSFSSDAKVEEVETKKRQLIFLYRTGQTFIFENPDNGQQIEIDKDLIGEKAYFFKKGERVNVLFWSPGDARDKEVPLGVELPPKVTLKIRQTDPGVRGDSVSNIWKPATLETGLSVKVPLFMNAGDRVVVDTRTGEYVERAK